MRSVLHVHLVLAPSEIVCCVVDAHAVSLFELVFSNIELAAVICSEFRGLGIILFAENAHEEVILEFHRKVLKCGQHRGTWPTISAHLQGRVMQMLVGEAVEIHMISIPLCD